MKRKICISTGCAHNPYVTDDINKQIKLFSKLDIDGMEILLGDAERLLRSKLNKESIKILKNFEFNTFHVPFYFCENHLYFHDNKLTKRIFNKIYPICDKINAKNINIHPQQINNFKILDKNYNYSIENM